MTKTFVFVKRFLNASLRRSFGEEVCSINLVRPLNKQELQKIERIIEKDPRLYEMFRRYEPKPIDSIYNARVSMPVGKSRSQLERMIPRDRVFTEFEIPPYLAELGLSHSGAPYWTLQFVSRDHEVADDCFQYRFSGILDF
jgi:hypothetical protein